ncbi:glycosyltransferase family 4 protein [Acinetobacter ursingii]|uniref:glycosyltransferase family 4 protein n=1 Tax=Acinetobacter ursingii TaxID=108980 RepID=UPI00254CCD7F|nr:glycosyltransferase family 4 protein [Acinetobacter ursingii]MEC6127699.1 glycosyltransferase family 4 protein [Acinetobacter ursingii]
MKVCFIISSLKYKSGIERVACVLANALYKSGYSVEIVNRDTKKNNVAYPLETGVKVYSYSGNYFKFYQSVEKHIQSSMPDHIVLHNMGKLSLLLSFLKIPFKSKLISLEHVAFLSRPKWVQFFYKVRAKKINQIVTLTQNDAQVYSSFHKNVTVINNISPFVLSLDKLSYRQDSKTVVSIGRLTYQKNFEDLLLAWSLINNEISDWSLHIYGTGEELHNLKKLIEERKIRNVTLKGQTDNVEQVYCNAAFYVMSSRYEGLPMVLIEAQTFGLPIISYDCPHGPAEVIKEDITGFLVENQNYQKLAEVMLYLIQNPDKRSQMSIQSLYNAKKYSVEFILEQWEKLVFTK